MYSSLRDSFIVVSFEMISRKGKEKGEEKDKERKRWFVWRDFSLIIDVLGWVGSVVKLKSILSLMFSFSFMDISFTVWK